MEEPMTGAFLIGLLAILCLPVLSALRLAGIISTRTDRIILLCLIMTWLVSRYLESGDLRRPRA